MRISGTLTPDAIVVQFEQLAELEARTRMQRCGHCKDLMPRSRQRYCGTDCKNNARFQREVEGDKPAVGETVCDGRNPFRWHGMVTGSSEVLTAEDAMREIAALWSRDHQGSEMKAIIDRWKASQ